MMKSKNPHQPGSRAFYEYMELEFRRAKYPISAPQKAILDRIEGGDTMVILVAYSPNKSFKSSKLVWLSDLTEVKPYVSARGLWKKKAVQYPPYLCPKCRHGKESSIEGCDLCEGSGFVSSKLAYEGLAKGWGSTRK